jgi:hypothetical protein
MYTILLVGLVAVISGITGVIIGHHLPFKKLGLDNSKPTPIAGQRVWLTGIGEVFILGYGTDDLGKIVVDYISDEILKGNMPSEISRDLLDTNTVSVPLADFKNHYQETGYIKAAKINN